MFHGCEAEHVPHLVHHHLVQETLVSQGLQVRRVEEHDANRRERVGGPDQAGPGGAEDAVDTVDRLQQNAMRMSSMLP